MSKHKNLAESVSQNTGIPLTQVSILMMSLSFRILVQKRRHLDPIFYGQDMTVSKKYWRLLLHNKSYILTEYQ